MNKYNSYEIKARAFNLMTGHMAPGKDVASAGYSASYEERAEAWEDWLIENQDIIKAMMLAVNEVMEEL